jgi:hypothetical protein
MPERAPSGPLDVRCPTCNAAPGHRCESRRGVTHQSRQDALKQYEVEQRRLDAWNRACQK